MSSNAAGIPDRQSNGTVNGRNDAQTHQRIRNNGSSATTSLTPSSSDLSGNDISSQTNCHHGNNNSNAKKNLPTGGDDSRTMNGAKETAASVNGQSNKSTVDDCSADEQHLMGAKASNSSGNCKGGNIGASLSSSLSAGEKKRASGGGGSTRAARDVSKEIQGSFASIDNEGDATSSSNTVRRGHGEKPSTAAKIDNTNMKSLPLSSTGSMTALNMAAVGDPLPLEPLFPSKKKKKKNKKKVRVC